jgi:hypothetical protein
MQRTDYTEIESKKEKDALIKREREIQVKSRVKEKKESVVERTGDSTCCLRDSKGLYL